jgi:tRNA A37 threonylcarbamoyladenosine biosynthesis protein TsaE
MAARSQQTTTRLKSITYRVNSKRELAEIGFHECAMSGDSIKLIEWADKANGSLPKERYSVIFHFQDGDDEARTIEIRHVYPTDVEEEIVIADHAE